MEEFLKIDWYPALDDVIDNVFIDETRLKNESAMYRIMRGVFKDPFTELESDDSEGEEGESEEEQEDEEGDDKDEKTKDDESVDDNHDDDVKTRNKESKIRKNDIHNQLKKKWIPSVGQSPPFRFPRSSNLTKSQQATCLRVLLRFSGSEKPEMNQKNRNELELYMKLLPTIKKEQDEFLNLAKANWKGSNMKLIGKEYINARWKYKVENVLKLPKYYVAGVNVPFNGETKIGIEFETTLLEMGHLPRVMMPLDDTRNILRCNVDKLYRLYPVHNHVFNDPRGQSTLSKVAVSQDPNCEQLAESNEVDLVISSGGLNCLATNLASNYNNSWILPIVVKGNEKRNIVYIDKPLPPISMTVMQKNAWIYKYILRSQLLYPRTPISMRSSEHEMEEVAEDDIFGNSHVDELLKLEEEYDTSPNYAAKKKADQSQPFENVSTMENEPMLNNTEDEGDVTASETKEESNLLPMKIFEKPLDTDHSSSMQENNAVNEKISMEFDCLQGAIPNSNVTVNMSNEKDDASFEFDSPENKALCSIVKVNTNNENDEAFVEFYPPEEAALSSTIKVHTNDKENKIEDERIKDDIVKVKKSGCQVPTKATIPPECLPPGNNVMYRIFSLGPTEDTTNDASKCKVDQYRMLVRARIDGIEKIGEQPIHPIMLLPKLEHQVELGAEAVTAEEALKQWMALTYRPDASLARVRISVENSEIIQVERRTAISINNEIKRLYKMNAEDSLITLHNVVHNLKTLKPGKYLLRHTPSNGAFATIYHEADSTGKNVFDLHATYSVNNFQTISKSPWPVIDTVVVTPALAHYERMPAMYYPTNPTISFQNARGRNRGGARDRGRGSYRGGRGGNSRDGKATSMGVKRVRTKQAKKKKKKVPKTEKVQQS